MLLCSVQQEADEAFGAIQYALAQLVDAGPDQVQGWLSTLADTRAAFMEMVGGLGVGCLVRVGLEMGWDGMGESVGCIWVHWWGGGVMRVVAVGWARAEGRGTGHANITWQRLQGRRRHILPCFVFGSSYLVVWHTA